MTNQEKLEKYEALRADGHTIESAAKELGVSKSTPAYWQRAMKKEKRKAKKTKRAKKHVAQTIVVEEPLAKHVFVFYGPENALNQVLERMNG